MLGSRYRSGRLDRWAGKRGRAESCQWLSETIANSFTSCRTASRTSIRRDACSLRGGGAESKPKPSGSRVKPVNTIALLAVSGGGDTRESESAGRVSWGTWTGINQSSASRTVLATNHVWQALFVCLLMLYAVCHAEGLKESICHTLSSRTRTLFFCNSSVRLTAFHR